VEAHYYVLVPNRVLTYVLFFIFSLRFVCIYYIYIYIVLHCIQDDDYDGEGRATATAAAAAAVRRTNCTRPREKPEKRVARRDRDDCAAAGRERREKKKFTKSRHEPHAAGCHSSENASAD